MSKAAHPANYVGANNKDRSDGDFYPTDPVASLPLFAHETFPGEVWEPCCGDGAISKVMISLGYTVVSSDLYNWGYGHVGKDFYLQTAIPPRCRSIVTNPPYEIKLRGLTLRVEDFIKHAWSFPNLEKMALLLKTTALAGKTRSVVLERCGFYRMYQFRRRLPFHPNGDKSDGKARNMIDFAWYLFDRNKVGQEPAIKWIDFVNPLQPSLL